MILNTYSIIIILFTPYIYILFTFLDYVKNKNAYSTFRFNINKSIFDAYPIVFRNIIIVIPITLLIVLNIFPIEKQLYSFKRELITFCLHVIWTDFYYYIFHYLCHYDKTLYQLIHKRHHEFNNTIGFMAFYASIAEIILLNIGGTILLHIFYKFSLYHILLFQTLSLYYSIMNAHTSSKCGLHQIHHLKKKFNYGFNIFMDRLLGTRKDTIYTGKTKIHTIYSN